MGTELPPLRAHTPSRTLGSSAHPPFVQGQAFRLERVVYIKMQIPCNPSAIFSFVPVDGTSDRLLFFFFFAAYVRE